MITDDPTTVQATGWKHAVRADAGLVQHDHDRPDLARLRLQNVDETGISTDFKQMTIKFGNNVSADKQLGVQGTSKLEVGGFDLDFDVLMISASDDIIKAIRDNREPVYQHGVPQRRRCRAARRALVDVEDAPADAQRNQSLRFKGKIGARRHPTLNYTASMSRLPFCPAS
jgi:hypothetical protein